MKAFGDKKTFVAEVEWSINRKGVWQNNTQLYIYVCVASYYKPGYHLSNKEKPNLTASEEDDHSAAFYHGPTYTLFKLPTAERYCFDHKLCSPMFMWKVLHIRIIPKTASYLKSWPNILQVNGSVLHIAVTAFIPFLDDIHFLQETTVSTWGGRTEKLILSMCQIQMNNFSPFHYCTCWGNHKHLQIITSKSCATG